MIYQDVRDRIRLCREKIGESAESIDSITCSLRSHRGLFEKAENWQHRQKIEWDSNENESSLDLLFSKRLDLSRLLIHLPALELDATNSIIRCDLKQRLFEEASKRKLKDQELKRLTNKNRISDPPIFLPTNQDFDRLCSENDILKAMLYIVYASSCENSPLNTRIEMLDRAASLIDSVHNTEKRLLANILEEENMMDPFQYVVTNRGYTSITVLLSRTKERTGFCQLLAKRYSAGGKITAKDVIFNGTGEFIPSKDLPKSVEITDLNPNQKIALSVASYNENLVGNNEKASKQVVLSTLPLPVICAWGYLANAAHSLNHYETANRSHCKLLNHFVSDIMPDNDLLKINMNVSAENSFKSSLFVVREAVVKTEPSCAVRNLIQSLFFTAENRIRIEQTLKTQNQTLRILAVRDCILALRLSEAIKDSMLCIMATIHCFSFISMLLKMRINSGFVIHALFSCHGAFIAHAEAALKKDAGLILRDYLCPITLNLIQLLLELREFDYAVIISSRTIKLIASLCPANDLSILNSSNMDIKFGLQPKKGQEKKKEGLKDGLSYHSKFATRKDSRQGLSTIREWNSIFYEFLETIVLTYKTSPVSFVPKSATLELSLSLYYLPFIQTDIMETFLKKNVDQLSNVNQIYSVLKCLGADIMYQQLSNFKKNPRYIELCTRCVWWAFHENQFDVCLKIFSDLCEWIDIRNSVVMGKDSNLDSVIKSNIANIRRKRMFFSKSGNAEKSSKKSKKSSKKASDKQPEELPVQKFNNPTVPKTPANIVEKFEDTSIFKVFDKHHRSNSAEAICYPDRKPSTIAFSMPDKFTRRARSRKGSAENIQVIHVQDTRVAPEVLEALRKRQKQTEKALYMASINPNKRDVVERSVFILDTLMVDLWRKSRVKRRMRALIQQEMMWRSRMSSLVAKAHLKMFEKDLLSRKIGLQLSYLPETTWFDLTTSSVIFEGKNELFDRLNSFGLSDSPELFKNLPDSLQYFIRAAQLASRVKAWPEVIENCQEIFRIYQIIAVLPLASCDSWKNQLWRGYFISGTILLQLLENIRFKNIHANDAIAGKSDSLKFLKMGDLPVISNSELITTDGFLGEWNIAKTTYSAIFDLRWISQFLMSTVENLAVNNKINRLIEFVTRFNSLYHGIFQPVLANVLNSLKLQNDLTVKVSDPSGKLSGLLIHCRQKFSVSTWLKLQEQPSMNVIEVQSFLIAAQDSYHKLIFRINQPSTHSERLLFILACQEYGDLLCVSSDESSAFIFWSKALDTIFSCPRFIYKWRKITSLKQLTETYSVLTLLLAANSCSKICQYSCEGDLDLKTDLVDLSRLLFRSVFGFSVINPKKDIDYLNYEPSTLPFTAESLDKFVFNKKSAIESLLFLTKKIITGPNPDEALPLLLLAEYFANSISANSLVKYYCKLEKIKILAALNDFSGAINMIYSLSESIIVPSEGKRRSIHAEKRHSIKNTMISTSDKTGMTNLSINPFQFDNTVALLESKNMKCLKKTVDLKILEKLNFVYGKEISNEYELTKYSLLMTIINTAHADKRTKFDSNSPHASLTELSRSSVSSVNLNNLTEIEKIEDYILEEDLIVEPTAQVEDLKEQEVLASLGIKIKSNCIKLLTQLQSDCSKTKALLEKKAAAANYYKSVLAEDFSTSICRQIDTCFLIAAVAWFSDETIESIRWLVSLT